MKVAHKRCYVFPFEKNMGRQRRLSTSFALAVLYLKYHKTKLS